MSLARPKPERRLAAKHGDDGVPGLARVEGALIYPHVFENADREVGGVLIGNASRTGGMPLVSGAIEALSADEQRASLTFTQAAWEHVHRTLDRDFPSDAQIVGWYHSHPGFGIFLSEHDLFIHRNFFSGASQIALVVDPIARTEGVFAWRDGDIDRLYERATPPGWVAKSSGAPVPTRPGVSVDRSAGAPATPSPLALLLAAVVGLGIGFGIWDVTQSAPSAVRTTSTSHGHRSSTKAHLGRSGGATNSKGSKEP